MADACDRYQPWVRTVAGHSPSDPYGVFPSVIDWEETRSMVENLARVFSDNVKVFMDSDPPAGQLAISDWPAMRATIMQRVDALPGIFSLGVGYGDSISQAFALGQFIACQLGEMEDEATDNGVQLQIPFKSATPPETITETVGGLGRGLLLLLGLYLLTKD